MERVCFGPPLLGEGLCVDWDQHRYGEHWLRAVKIPALVSYSAGVRGTTCGRLREQEFILLHGKEAGSTFKVLAGLVPPGGLEESVLSASARLLVAILTSHRSGLLPTSPISVSLWTLFSPH